jgi:hypothetical protein
MRARTTVSTGDWAFAAAVAERGDARARRRRAQRAMIRSCLRQGARALLPVGSSAVAATVTPSLGDPLAHRALLACYAMLSPAGVRAASTAPAMPTEKELQVRRDTDGDCARLVNGSIRPAARHTYLPTIHSRIVGCMPGRLRVAHGEGWMSVHRCLDFLHASTRGAAAATRPCRRGGGSVPLATAGGGADKR